MQMWESVYFEITSGGYDAKKNLRNIDIITFPHFPDHRTTLKYISRGNEILISKRHLHSHVYCITVHNSQDMELTKVSISR
jgi:hypothetical protein